MKQTKKHPVLVIEYPDGTVVKIYQHLNMEFVKEILDQFWTKKGWLKPALQFDRGVAITGLKVGLVAQIDEA